MGGAWVHLSPLEPVIMASQHVFCTYYSPGPVLRDSPPPLILKTLWWGLCRPRLIGAENTHHQPEVTEPGAGRAWVAPLQLQTPSSVEPSAPGRDRVLIPPTTSHDPVMSGLPKLPQVGPCEVEVG